MDLKEKIEMENLKERIIDEYAKYFNGLVKFCKLRLNSSVILCADFFLAKNDTEVEYRIWENDMFHISFNLRFIDDNTTVLENKSKSYLIKPKDSYRCYSRQKISFRKTKGNEDKIITSLSRFFERLYISVLKDRKNNLLHPTFNKAYKNINFKNPLYNKIKRGEL